MLLALGCSMRIGEILGLTWDCVDLSEETLASGNASLFINKELKRCEKSSVEALEKRGRSKVFFTFPEWKRTNCKTMLTLKTPKTASSVRTVFLPKTVALALIETKNRQDEEKMLLGSDYKDFNLVLAQPGVATRMSRGRSTKCCRRLFRKTSCGALCFTACGTAAPPSSFRSAAATSRRFRATPAT